jgi:uncharacterized protein YrrD
MLKVSQLMKMKVYAPKRSTGDEDLKALDVRDLKEIGVIHQAVFEPSGKRVAGFLVRRPDVGGVVKREDAFLARDAYVLGDYGFVCSMGDDSLDEKAHERLGLDWDRCIVWLGMDARTEDGRDLGWVTDISFFPKSGKVKYFYVDDGNVAKSLVGSVEIPPDLLVGYQNGYMVVDDEAATLSLDGGLAAKAGESYAKAKIGGKKAVAKAGGAVEKGAYGMGKAIGSAQRAVKKKTGGKSASEVVGKQLGRTKGMFGSFLDEYKKASK